MKKVFVFILLFSFSFTILCGCGPLSPAPEGTVTPTKAPLQPSVFAPTDPPAPTPTPAPTLPPDIVLEDEGSSYFYLPNYSEITIDESCMKFVDFKKNLQKMGYRTTPYCINADCFDLVNQFITYPVNVVGMGENSHKQLCEVVSYDIVNNTIADVRPFLAIDGFGNLYHFLQEDGTFKTYDSKEEFDKRRQEENRLYSDKSTTISEKLGGLLTGGIYDIEYLEAMDYAIISHNEKYAFVCQSLEFSPSLYDSNFNVLQLREEEPQVFSLLDMESGDILKTYTIGMQREMLDIKFSTDDNYIIMHFGSESMGNFITHTVALVIDIEASLAEETPEE